MVGGLDEMKEGRDEERESWGGSPTEGGGGIRQWVWGGSPAVGGARGCRMSKTWCWGGGGGGGGGSRKGGEMKSLKRDEMKR